jgi:hypothetical protein
VAVLSPYHVLVTGYTAFAGLLRRFVATEAVPLSAGNPRRIADRAELVCRLRRPTAGHRLEFGRAWRDNRQRAKGRQGWSRRSPI